MRAANYQHDVLGIVGPQPGHVGGQCASVRRSGPVVDQHIGTCLSLVCRLQKCGTGAGISRVEAGVYKCCTGWRRSEEHTSELQSLMRISYAVFCLKKKIENHHGGYELHKHACDAGCETRKS